MTSNSIKSGVAAFAAIAVTLLAGCKPQTQAPAATGGTATPATGNVATVDGTPISRSVFEFTAKSLTSKPAAELTQDQRTQILDEIINTQLLADQGLKDGVDKDTEVAARLAVSRLRLLADGESAKYLKGKEPTEQDLRVEYETALLGMDKTEYRARHILVATKELADQLTAKLKAGANFEEMAKSQSMDGSGKNGGDIGWFTPSRMAKPFADAVKALKKGETTAAPVQTQFGWHIIKLEDTRETTPPPFDQAKEQLTNRIMQKKLQAYVDQLKKTAKIDKTP